MLIFRILECHIVKKLKCKSTSIFSIFTMFIPCLLHINLNFFFVLLCQNLTVVVSIDAHTKLQTQFDHHMF
jgi:hypothetical protein